MVMIGMTDPIDTITVMIGDLMGRLGGERQFMIGWGGRLSVHDRLGDRVEYFPRNREELEEMANAQVPDEFIFAGMLILIGWSQGKVVAQRQGSHHFPHGVQRG